MNQPTKDALREQLALAADEIIGYRALMLEVSDSWLPKLQEAIDADIARASRRWWHRFAWWRA